MTNKILVSKLVEEDKEKVRRILVESYQEYENQYEDPQVWKDYLAEIDASVDNPNIDRILVAKKGHQILGTLQLFQSSEKAYGMPKLQIESPIIRLLAVHPQARGQGAAKELLHASISYAKEHEAKHLYLHSSDKMVKAIKLYEWIGFKRDEKKDFISKDILAKCFRLDI